MRKLWTIRGRTALVFAVTSMALVAAVLVFVNTASRLALPIAIDQGAGAPVVGTTGASGAVGAAGSDAGDRQPPRPLATISPDPTVAAQTAARDEAVAIVSLASTVQWQWSAIGVVGSGVLAGGLGWLVSRRMLRPIDRITETARRIGASTMHERIGLGGPDDELRRLSRTVDDLLDRLETAFASQRRFVAHAAHELRTPLAVQRAAIQIGLQGGADEHSLAETREELLAQNRRTEHLVDSLLTLAEVERGLDDVGVPLDLEGIAVEAVGALREQASAAGIVLRLEQAPRRTDDLRGSPVGDPVLVQQALRNLVDNAVEYNVPDGFVAVHVLPDGFRVVNSGPAIARVDLGQLAEPFRRGTNSGTRRHSGLGLSIVRAVAVAHGWSLDLGPRPGGGLDVVLRAGRR